MKTFFTVLIIISLTLSGIAPIAAQGTKTKTPTKAKPRPAAKLPQENVAEHEVFRNLMQAEEFEQANALLTQYGLKVSDLLTQLRQQQMAIELAHFWYMRAPNDARYLRLLVELNLSNAASPARIGRYPSEAVRNMRASADYATFDSATRTALNATLLAYASAYQHLGFDEQAIDLLRTTVDYSVLSSADTLNALQTLIYAGISNGSTDPMRMAIDLLTRLIPSTENPVYAMLNEYKENRPSVWAEEIWQKCIRSENGSKMADMTKDMQTSKRLQAFTAAAFYAIVKEKPMIASGDIRMVKDQWERFANTYTESLSAGSKVQEVEERNKKPQKDSMDIFIALQIIRGHGEIPKDLDPPVQKTWEKFEAIIDSGNLLADQFVDIGMSLAAITINRGNSTQGLSIYKAMLGDPATITGTNNDLDIVITGRQKVYLSWDKQQFILDTMKDTFPRGNFTKYQDAINQIKNSVAIPKIIPTKIAQKTEEAETKQILFDNNASPDDFTTVLNYSVQKFSTLKEQDNPEKVLQDMFKILEKLTFKKNGQNFEEYQQFEYAILRALIQKLPEKEKDEDTRATESVVFKQTFANINIGNTEFTEQKINDIVAQTDFNEEELSNFIRILFESSL